MKLLPLDTIFDQYETDKGPSFHHYTRHYERLLHDWRDKPVKYLEIGVHHGGSLHAMRQVFSHVDTCIVGIDINPDAKQYEDISQHIFIEIGDATDHVFLDTILQKYGTFDVVLDDGSHTNKDVIQSFEYLFPHVNNDGIYIIEDTVCYQCTDYIHTAYPNHLDYFFQFTPFLNQWRMNSASDIKDNCVDPFKIQKKTSNIFEYSIDRIEYGCSYISIHKKIRSHWKP